jgi:hypothetical protein
VARPKADLGNETMSDFNPKVLIDCLVLALLPLAGWLGYCLFGDDECDC